MLPFLWTTSTYLPFQHITIDYICHTHHSFIIMAKTNRTNSHSEEPTRHSNRTSGKSPPNVALTAHKPASARKATSARKDTAASPLHGGSEKFSGERKGPPEAIVPGPEAIVPHLPPMPTLVGIDFAAAGDDFACFGKSLPLSYLLMLQQANPSGVTRK